MGSCTIDVGLMHYRALNELIREKVGVSPL